MMKTETKSAPDVSAFKRLIVRTPSDFVLPGRLSLPSVVLLTKEGPTQSNLVKPSQTKSNHYPPPCATKSDQLLPGGKYSAHPIQLSNGLLQ
jgi:hypothetical protein